MAESGGKKNIGTYVFIILVILVFSGTLVFVLRPERKPAMETEPVFSGWIYHREDQKTANGALAKAGLCEYRWNDGQLSVPRGERSRYEQVLAESKAFPRAPGDVKREALREMNQFEPLAKLRLRDLYSAGWQLEQTLEHFSTQISYATVGVRSRAEQRGMIQKNIVTASVGVWPRDDIPLSAELLSAITLAAKHHLGITENDNISILDLRHGCSYLGTDAGVTAPLSSQARQEHLRQDYWNEKFLVAFRHIPGIKVSTTIIRPVAKTIPTLTPQAVPEKVPEEPVRPTTFAVLGNRVPSTYVSRPVTSGVPAVHASIDQNVDSKTSSDLSEESRATSGSKISVSIAIPESYIKDLAQQEGRERLTPGNKFDITAFVKRRGEEVAARVKQEALGLLREVFLTEGDSPLRDETQVQVSIVSSSIESSLNATTLEKPVMPPARDLASVQVDTPPKTSARDSVHLEARLLELWKANRRSPLFWIAAVAAMIVIMAVVVASGSFLIRRLGSLLGHGTGRRPETARRAPRADMVEDTLELRCDPPVEETKARSADEATRVINQWLRAS